MAKRIKEAFGWSSMWDLQFMYSSGRQASLEDVENSSSWDLATVKALMGSGCLYVSRFAAIESEISRSNPNGNTSSGSVGNTSSNVGSDTDPALDQDQVTYLSKSS